MALCSKRQQDSLLSLEITIKNVSGYPENAKRSKIL